MVDAPKLEMRPSQPDAGRPGRSDVVVDGGHAVLSGDVDPALAVAVIGAREAAVIAPPMALCMQPTNYRSSTVLQHLPSIRMPALADHPRIIIYFQETSPAS